MATSHSKDRTSKSARSETVVSPVTPDEVQEWVDAAASVEPTCEDVIPAGWYTMQQLADDVFHKSLSTANRRVINLLNGGLAEVKNFRLRRNGRLKVVPHYKLKKK